MSFIGFLLVVILVYYIFKIFYRLFFPRLLMWLVRRRMQSHMDNMWGQQRQQTRQQRSSTTQSRPRRHGKIINKDVGEYVDFEEIPGAVQSQVADEKRKHIKVESQIEDVKWEDID